MAVQRNNCVVAVGMASQGNMDGQHRPRVGAGLQNMGNTCFLNAVLQCLTYTSSLAHYLLSREHSQSCVQLADCVMCRVQEHVHKVLHPTASAIKPLDVLTVLPRIGKQFQLDMQEDAHEFLRCTLDAMGRACLPAGSNLDIQLTIVYQIFGGFLRSRVMCSSCQVTSDIYEPFLDVLLDIKDAASLTEALKNFVKPELLDGENRFKCRHCGQMAAASKRMTIHGAPQVLTVGLKRFEVFTGGKISKVVRYPEILDLGPYMSEASGEAQLYSLYAVLVHRGDNCHSGHYYCYTKASNGLWYKMDDSSVTPCGINIILQQEAYLLFYARCSDLKTEAWDSSSTASSQIHSSINLSLAGNQQPSRKASGRRCCPLTPVLGVSHSPGPCQRDGSLLNMVVGMEDSPEDSSSPPRASTVLRSQERRVPASDNTKKRSQEMSSFGPSSTGLQFPQSNTFGTATAGQLCQESGSYGSGSPAHRSHQSDSSPPASNSQPSQAGAQGASAGWLGSLWPGRLSITAYLGSCLHRFFCSCLRLVCRRKAVCTVCCPPLQPVLHTRQDRSNKEERGFIPSSPCQSAQERPRSRSPQWGNHLGSFWVDTRDYDHSTRRRRTGPLRCEHTSRAEASPGPSGISSRFAPTLSTAQEQTLRRRRECRLPCLGQNVRSHLVEQTECHFSARRMGRTTHNQTPRDKKAPEPSNTSSKRSSATRAAREKTMERQREHSRSPWQRCHPLYGGGLVEATVCDPSAGRKRRVSALQSCISD